MYCPSHFAESDLSVLQQLIQAHPFGTLITHDEDGPHADHLPFLLLPQASTPGVLQAHVARNNPVWRRLQANAQTLVIFQAGDAYVSPQWYPSKALTHQQVPTWNYIVAHARGKAVVRDDMRFVRGVVGKLTRVHEASQPTPWKMSDSPASYIDAMLEAIVGLEIPLDTLQGKFKLSQNKAVSDVQGAAQGLQATGPSAIAQAMLAALQTRDSTPD